MTGDKLCKQCGRRLPITDFPQRRDKRGKLYRSSPCRACTNMGVWICRNRSKATLTAHAAESRAYYEANRAAVLAQKAAYYRANIEAKRQYAKRRRMRRALARLEQTMATAQEPDMKGTF